MSFAPQEGRRPPAELIALGLAILAAAPAVHDLVVRWLDPLGYESHGPLVLLVSAWLLGHERRAMTRLPRSPSRWGVVACALASGVLALAAPRGRVTAEAFALVLLALGLALALVGWSFVRRGWFAFAYSLLLLPAPLSVSVFLSVKLQKLTALLSTEALHAIGVPAVRDGVTILLDGTQVTVGEACSGLRGLAVFVALAALVASFRQRRVGAVAVLLLAGPIAVLANVGRILVLCWLALRAGAVAEEGLLHETSGLLVYLLGFVMMLAVHAPFRLPEPAPEGDAAPAEPGSRTVPRSLFVVLLLGALGVLVARGTSDRTAVVRSVLGKVPTTVGPWSGSDAPASAYPLAAVGADDLVLRRFARPDGGAVEVYIAHSARDPERIWHPPEHCYLAAGYDVAESTTGTVCMGSRTIAARRFVFQHGPQGELVYYWYRVDGHDVASFFDFEAKSLLGRAFGLGDSEATLIRVQTTTTGGVPRAEERLRTFESEALEAVLAPVYESS